jgi:hypothetical protein
MTPLEGLKALMAIHRGEPRHVALPEPEDKSAAKELKKLRAEIAKRDAEQQEIDLASSLRFKPWNIPVPEVHEPESPGYPVLNLSDWHWGEKVDIRETGGVNEFNLAVARDRVECLVNTFIRLLRDYSGRAPTYPGLWVNLIGDMISGKIHEELRETNWGTVEEQAYEVGCALSGVIERLREEFSGPIDIACVVGNHGRNAIKPRAKTKVRENREWGIYKSLEHQYADENLHFHIPDGPDYHFEIFGHKFLLTHGDALGTKGGDGIIGPIGPLRRGYVKIRGGEVPIGRDFTYLICGHWHTYQPPGVLFPVMVNGSLKGPDEYTGGMLRAGYPRACQSFFIVSPKFGLVHPEAIFL